MAKSREQKKASQSRPVSRGIALFLGAFALLNVLASLVSKCPGITIWWLDFTGAEELVGFWGRVVTLAFEALAGGFLVAWAVRPAARTWRRVVTAIEAFCLAVAALCNAVSFWHGLALGRMSALVPVPLSLVLAISFLIVGVRVATASRDLGAAHAARGLVGTVAVALVCALVFPLLQVATFGTTDYRRSATAVIVPGARLADDRSLTALLQDRMDVALALVEEEGAGTLVVSGGTEASGANEASAMASYARERLGAGVSVEEDSRGTSLETSARNTAALVGQTGTVLVTSSFYQMPRIKMLYLAAGRDVRTVPILDDVAAGDVPEALLREVPSWWACWFSCYL